MTRHTRETDMTETIERLAEIRCEIAALIDETRELLRGTPEADRAKRTWLAHIRCALDNDHAYLGGSMITLQDTIDALAAEEADA